MAGADRIRCIYHIPPAEKYVSRPGTSGDRGGSEGGDTVGGRSECRHPLGSATAMLEELRCLSEEVDEEEQRHRARRAGRGDTVEVSDIVLTLLVLGIEMRSGAGFSTSVQWRFRPSFSV